MSPRSTPEARAEYMRMWRRENKAQALPADDPRHGTTYCYHDFGCRCAPCRYAAAQDRRSGGSK